MTLTGIPNHFQPVIQYTGLVKRIRGGIKLGVLLMIGFIGNQIHVLSLMQMLNHFLGGMQNLIKLIMFQIFGYFQKIRGHQSI